MDFPLSTLCFCSLALYCRTRCQIRRNLKYRFSSFC
ncbi:hypothetical protein AHF37_01474 [Paragonimus kellicotti]|nr:hypothetical protein AHF37_01474 [Paragonimus kellicotti]